MVTTEMELFNDAKTYWHLETLYADITSSTGHELTKGEKTSLRGLLCGHSPTFIALKTGCKASTKRTELSRNVYPLIASLIDQKGINWEVVAELLEEAGYKKPTLHILQSDLLDLETRANLNSQDKVDRASVIIASVEEQLQVNSNSTALKLNNISSLNRLVEQGDNQQKQGNFSKAINFYFQALLIEPSCVEVIIQIARCFDRLKLYEDSLLICDFALLQLENKDHQSLKKTNKQKSQVYIFLGGVFHELALYNYRKFYVDSAVSLYRKAIDDAPLDSTIAAWNIVDLYISLFKQNEIASEERELYISRAKQAWYSFQGTAQDPEFNFKSCQNLILEDVKSARNGLDNWWYEQLDKFEIFCNSSQPEE